MKKKRPVKLNADARADLREIGDFIAEENPRRARSFVRELRLACHELADMSERFAFVGLREGDILRRRPYGSYAIFYDVQDDHVRVLRIVNASRDIEQLFAKD